MRRSNQYLSLIISIVAVVSLYFAYRLISKGEESSNHVKIIEMVERMEREGVPGFESKDIFGNKVLFLKTDRKIKIINFWASWCEPCLAEVPSLVELIKLFDGQIELYAISEDHSNLDVNIFLKSFPGMKNDKIHIILDEDQRLMNLYGTERLPESYIVDQKGRLVKKVIGTINWHTKDSESFIKNVLSKSE